MEESGVIHLHVIDCLHLGLIEPLDTLAILPQSILYFVVLGHHICAKTMLLAFVPVALVAPLVCPLVNAEAMLLVILVLASILTAIIPNVDSHALHVIVQPLTLVLTAIKPRVNANARDLILSPVARVHRPIVPLVTSNAMLAAKGIVTLIP